MECNKNEAARAKALAERKMLDKDFVAAKKVIMKAWKLSKEVADIDIQKMLTICDVHCAAGAKVNTEIDWYGILQVPVTADDALINKEYRKLALWLHPDKNKFGGSETAFKLVGEAKIILTDQSKRSLYDMKRNTLRHGAARPPYQQSRRPAPARSRATSHQASNPAGPQTTFWTMCPSCGMRYKYYISILNKALRCQNCLKPFIAHRVHVDTDPRHADVNTKRETDGYTGGLRKKTKSDQCTRNPSKSLSTAGMKRSRRVVVESSESSTSETSSEEEILEHGLAANSAGLGQQIRRSSRQKQEVKYNEESDDDDAKDHINKVDEDFVNSPGLKRLRKSGLFHGDHSNKATKLNEDVVGHNGINSCSNTEDKEKGGAPCVEKTFNGIELKKRKTIHSGENGDGKEKVSYSVSSNGPDNCKFTLLAPEFFDFNQLRDQSQFRANQVWAVYDDQGCMPRFYARITKVRTTPNFMLHFVWLEFYPTNKPEEAWSFGGLPVACGRFKHRVSGTSKETAMFSRNISFDFVESKTRSFYEIYPRKGEVWALFKVWDIVWGLDADNHKYRSHQYEVVQVLSDLTTSTNSKITVMPLVKIKGYVSLFMQSREVAPNVIPQGDTLRFSHCIPHHVMSGTEKEGIPEGSLELDPAALPLDLEEVFPSVIPECCLVRNQEHDAKCAGSSNGSSDKGSVNFREAQHTCMNERSSAPEEVHSKHNTSIAEVTTVDDDTHCQTEYVNAEPEFYDFSEISLLQKFSPGQIWAIYSDVDKFPNYYGFIQKVDLKNVEVQVRWLDVCPQGKEEIRLLQEERPIGCGTFRLSSTHDLMTYSRTGTDAFSHRVEAISTGEKGQYEIIPHLGEIWAVYKNWRAGWTAQDFEKCEYELVEIVGYTDSSLQVQLLRKVDGYRVVFMPYRAEGHVKTISKDEYPKFSHQIPCFHLTHEKGGKLRGCLELDPFSLPEEFLVTD